MDRCDSTHLICIESISNYIQTQQKQPTATSCFGNRKEIELKWCFLKHVCNSALTHKLTSITTHLYVGACSANLCRSPYAHDNAYNCANPHVNTYYINNYFIPLPLSPSLIANASTCFICLLV